jgi:hypothetical protein
LITPACAKGFPYRPICFFSQQIRLAPNFHGARLALNCICENKSGEQETRKLTQ